MKLLIITAVKDFEDEITKILVKSGSKVFSYMPAMGYKDEPSKGIEENWFGSGIQETESIVFMAFVPKENEDLVYQKVEDFNNNDAFESRIHLVTLDTERTI